MKIIFATGNRHKLEEVQNLMPAGIELMTPSDKGINEEIPENETTLEGNARSKSMYIHERTGCDCFADDTGLEVEALDGEPGVRSARFAADAGCGTTPEDNMTLLLEKMKGITNRRARFRTVVSLILDGEEHQFEGMVEGVIRTERSGSAGFGYDPVFQPDGYDITFAEMQLSEKNRVSHRARAINKLTSFLSNKL